MCEILTDESKTDMEMEHKRERDREKGRHLSLMHTLRAA